MRKLPNLLGSFIKQHSLTKSSLMRFSGVLTFSALSSIGIVYFNYENYWKVTINRVQTVDFNILANVLPSKLSTQLLTNDKKSLQTTLDSNYGLFGIIVTDCKSVILDCYNQKVIYASKSIVKTTPDGKQKLEPQQNEYSPSWVREFNDTDYPTRQLINGDFLILRDPPPLKQEWKFKSPRVSEKILTGEQNSGNVIGRVYLLRGNPPSFQSELQAWLKNPINISSKTVVYNAIAGSALFTGLVVWFLSELVFYIKINADRKELATEKKANDAAQQELAAEKKANDAAQQEREAEKKISEATQIKLEAAEQVLSANQREQEAKQKATDAERKELEAARKANDAAQREREAERKVSEAAQRELETAKKISEATQIKLEAAKQVLSANQREQEAKQKATDAERKELEAARKANDAAQREREAEQKATDADRKELEAARRANNAAQREQEAEQKAKDAAQKELAAETKIRQAAEQVLIANQKQLDAEYKANEAAQQELAIKQNAQEELEAAKKVNEAAQKELENAKKVNENVQHLTTELNSLTQDNQYLYDSIADEGNKTKQELENKRKENKSLIRENEVLRQENESLQLRVNKTSRFSNAIDALEYAESTFPVLEIWDSAKESARSGNDGLSYSPDRVFQNLSLLANIGSDYFLDLLDNDFHKCLKQKGLNSSTESDTTKNKKKKPTRKFNNGNGESQDMYDHLKIGDLRIHFYLCKSDKKVKIGHCGKHL
jgi:hypothetical protein